MQPSEFKQELISFCKVAKMEYTINDHSLSTCPNNVINRRHLTTMCDNWYMDHANDQMIFEFDTGLVYSVTLTEVATYNELIKNTPPAIIKAKYGVAGTFNTKNKTYIKFLTREDAFGMSFLLITTALNHCAET